MNVTTKKFQSYLKKSVIGKMIDGFDVVDGALTLLIDAENVAKICTFLRDDSELLFKVLIDICGVDYPQREKRFDVMYQLLSMAYNGRITLRVRVAEDDLVQSVTGVFSTATWFEREIWDLFGIPFAGNPDLRRILTDYGFQGHPLRKDFPLTGYVELRYDEAQKRVVYEPVELQQDFRRFDFMSPWEGMTEVQLPGDEKATVQSVGTDFDGALVSVASGVSKTGGQK